MEEKIELICEDCSKTFMSTDSDAQLCPECWEKAISANLEGEGRGENE